MQKQIPSSLLTTIRQRLKKIALFLTGLWTTGYRAPGTGHRLQAIQQNLKKIALFLAGPWPSEHRAPSTGHRPLGTGYRISATLGLIILITTSACVTHSELLNFSQGSAFPTTPEAIPEIPVLKIQPDDLLSIRVQALDMEAALPYNVDPLTSNTSNIGNSNSRPLLGYLVDHEGYIDFPVLGRIKVGGLTTGEVRELLISKLKPNLLKDPVVIVRFLNFRITVLGEVGHPGTFQVATERFTVLDALGEAGDLQPYANRTNILIAREQNGERTYGYLNLQDRNIFESRFYFLQQNDFIYVEPLPERVAALRDQSQRVLPYISAGVTLITLIIAITR